MRQRAAVLALFLSGVASTLPLHAGVDRWTPLASPLRSLISPVVVDPERPSTLYAVGTGLRELWKSYDGGGHWTLLRGGLDWRELAEWPLQGPVFDPWDSRRLWVWSEYTVWFSADGGGHWTQRLAPEVLPLAIDQLLPDPATSERLLAVSDRAVVIVSEDGGASWEPAGRLPEGATASWLYAHPTDPSVLYLRASSGLFQSHDGGRSWTLVSDYAGGGFQELSIAPSSPQTLYAVPALPPDRLLRSDDGGATWQPAGPPGSFFDLPSILVDPRDERQITVVVYRQDGYSLFASHDGGRTWPEAPVAVPGPFLVADPRAPGAFYSAPDLQKSTDGGRSWRALGQDVQAGNLLSVAAAPGAGRAILYASAFDGSRTVTYRSDDSGGTWQTLATPVFGLDVVASDPQDRDRVFGLGGGVYRSDDRGGAWHEVSPPGLAAAVDILVDRVQADRLFVATRFGGVWRSEDGGETWLQSTQGLPVQDDCPHSWSCPVVGPLAVDALASERVFVVVDGGLYRSDDGGGIWRGAGAGLPSTYAVVAHPARAGLVFAGTSEGVFQSDDGGETWAHLPGLDAVVRYLLIDGSTLDLYATTDHSILRRRLRGFPPLQWQELAEGLPEVGFGEIRGLAADPRSPGRVYLALSSLGVWSGRFVGAPPLELHSGRFEIRAALSGSRWVSPAAGTRLSEESGELGGGDGCGAFQALVRLPRAGTTFRFFAGTLSRLELELTVVDRLSGIARDYLLPRGGRRALADLSGFPAATFSRSTSEVVDRSGGATSCSEEDVLIGGRLCVGARVQVDGAWLEAQGGWPDGTCSVFSRAAVFRVERPTSYPIGVRVAEEESGLTLFYTVLTRHPWELTVTDRETGARRTYSGSGRPSSRIVVDVP